MKKITIALLILLTSLTMVGCSNKSSKALASFDSQLDYIDEIVGSTNSSEVAEVSPAVIYNNNSSKAIQDHKVSAYNNMTREEELRQQVLSLNSYLKSFSCDKLKLSKGQISALKTFTSNIKKYTVQLKNTKSEVKTYVSTIKKGLRNSNISDEATESSYIALNNSMNERFVYLCNIYNNLEEAYILIYKDCETAQTKSNQQLENNSQIEQQTQKQTTKAETEDKENKTFKKNIDSYNNFEGRENNNTSKQNNEIVKQPPYYNQYQIPNRQPYNMPYNHIPYGQYPYSPYNGYGYGNNFMYNGMYGYNGIYNGNQFNPSRNTDTFYSFNRNIDTYKFSPNISKSEFQNNLIYNEVPTTPVTKINEKDNDADFEEEQSNENHDFNNIDEKQISPSTKQQKFLDKKPEKQKIFTY